MIKSGQVIILFLMLFAIILVGGYYHEIRHQQIFDHFGVESKITIDFKGMYTVPSDNFDLSDEEISLMYSYHENSDNIKYNLAVVEIFLVLIFFVMCLMFIDKEKFVVVKQNG